MPFLIAYRHGPNAPWSNDEEHIYESGDEASRFSKERNALYKQWGDPVRTRVVPIPIDDPLAWRIREEAKFADGTYKRPPWFNDWGGGMLEHIDPDDPTKIRFFASNQEAHRGRYTSMAPGRFFVKYINSYPNPGTVEQYCAKMGLDLTVSKLLFGKTADEFEYVYTNGPHSCMAYEFSEEKFLGHEHPVRAYGGLDLQIAYITRAGDITGRAMVWPEKKIHGRIYGDRERMLERLKEEGYEEDWNFIGARLHCHRNDDGSITAPYIDGDIDGNIEGDYIILTNQPTAILKSPDGVVEATSCQRCGAEGILGWSDNYETYVCQDKCALTDDDW